MRLATPKGLKALTVAVAGFALLSVTACASTRTQKSAGETVDDAVLTTRVKAALIGEPTTKARKIDVETFKGIVQLNGFVETAAEKSKAGSVARGVEGVASVRNNLDVQSGERTAGRAIDDATLTAKVKTALIDNPDTKAHQIEVATREGVVQLSGFVNNSNAKSTAAMVARSVTGVKSVDNQIDVK